VSALGLGFAGYGHGWTSASLSVVSIVFAPIAGVAWSLRKKQWGVITSILVVTGATYFDFALWLSTDNEGWEHVAKVWKANPISMLLWGSLLASWQLLATAAMLSACRRSYRFSLCTFLIVMALMALELGVLMAFQRSFS
jgi:hypothetical protein